MNARHWLRKFFGRPQGSTKQMPIRRRRKTRLEAEFLELRLAPAVSLGPVSAYAGNGNAGFGGAVGQGTLTLIDSGTTLYGTIATPGNFGNAFVLYVQASGPGEPAGFSDTSGFSDTGPNDGLRQAISGFTETGNGGGSGRSLLTFQTGFTPNYAIALKPTGPENFGGLWQLADGGDGSLHFITSANLTPTNNNSGPYTFSVPLGAGGLGLTNPGGATIELLGTYISNTGYRSTEAIAGNVSSGAGSPQGWVPFTQTTAASYTTSTGTLPAWTVNLAGYSETFGATGGTGPYTFSSTTGTVPPGLTLSSAGVLSGTPTVAGSYSFTITASDSIGATGSASYAVVINPAVAITTSTLPNTNVTAVYSQTIIATGGTGALTFSQTSGTLPAGMTLGSGGVLSGTATTEGSYTFTVTATDAIGASASQSYTVLVQTVLSMPITTLSGRESGKVLAFPISISQLEDGASPTDHVGLASATIALTFPTGVFSFPVGSSLATADVHLGAIPLAHGGSSHWTLSADSPQDGVLNISLTATSGAITTDTGGGSLVTIDFPVSNIYNPSSPTSETITIVHNTTTITQIIGNNGPYNLFPAPPYTGTVTINHATQFPPTVSSPQSYSTEANTALDDSAPGLLTGAHDPQSQKLTVSTIDGTAIILGSADALPSGASVTVNSDGSFSYTPANNFAGTDSFTFTVVDQGGNASSPATVNIAVTPTLSLVPEVPATGNDGTMIPVDVVLDNPVQAGPGALAGFNLAVTYNPSALGIDATGVALGSDVPTDWQESLNTATQGLVALGAFGGNTASDVILGPGPVVLATLDFTIIASANQTTPIKLQTGVPIASGTVNTVLTGANSSDFSITPTLDSGLYLPGVDVSVSVTGESTDITFNTGSLADADVGAMYRQTVYATGGNGHFVYSLANGSLPPGLTAQIIDDPIYVISGIPQTSGQVGFSVTATDTAHDSASQPYAVMVHPAVALAAASLSAWTTNLPNYSQTLVATGGDGSYSFSNTAGTLPTGLTLSTDGVLSGTPTVAGTYTFSATVTDTLGGSASQSFTVTINPPVSISTMSLPNWTAAHGGYNQLISATGGTGTLTFSSTGTLPAGLSLSNTGTLSGTPTVAGSYSFTVTASDSLGASTSQPYAVVINPAVQITTGTLANWTVNQPSYSQVISTTGGTAPVTVAASSGTLPIGLSLSSTGALSGKPTQTGTYTFTITATDSVGASASAPYTVVINPALTITPTTLPHATVGVSYDQTITPEGGTGNVAFILSAGSTHPGGLSLNLATGQLSGTPTLAGTYTVGLIATDTVGASTSATYTLVINPGVLITTTSLPADTLNVAYNQSISATGGTGTYSFATSSGTLPAGLTLSSAGVVSGTPTAAGSYSFTVTATDTAGASTSQPYTVTINAAVAIATSTVPDGAVSSGYSQMIMATGGTGTLTFSSSGTLPAGLTLSNSGVLSGTPTTVGSYTFTVTATDSVDASASQSFTVTINPNPALAYTATGTSPTAYVVKIVGGNLELQDGSGNVLASGPVTSTTSVTITGNPGGGNTLTLDFTAGTLPPTINFNAVSGGTLVINGNGESGSYTPAGAHGSGSATVGGTTINFMNLTPVEVSNVATWVVNTPTVSDDLTVSESAAPSNSSQSAVKVSGASGFEAVYLYNVGTLTVSTPAASNDTVDIAGVNFAADTVSNFTLNTGSDGADAVTFDTGTTTISGSLQLSTSTSSTVNVDAAVSAGTVTGNAAAAHVAAPGQIQVGVDLVTSGATVHVAAGTYDEHVEIAKALTLLGANANINPNTGTRGAESIIDGQLTDAPLAIDASNVTVNGFTIQEGENGRNAGIAMSASTSGVDILDNIITSNTIGIYANSNGPSTIQDNKFDANNVPGPAGGTSIYSENTNGLVIDSNVFTGQTINNPVIFGATAAGVHQNLQFTNNVLDNNVAASAVYCVGITGGLFSGNNITTEGQATGIRLGGADSNITITGNNIHNNLRGVGVFDDGYGLGDNSNVTINLNDFTGISSAPAVDVDSSYVGGPLDATHNYWDAASGPTTPANPLGTGASVSSGVTFSPFATNAALTAFATPGVAITTTSLPGGEAGVAYNQTITAIGGTGTLTFSDAPPPGLTLSTGGVLSGAPSAPGSFTFTVTVTDSLGVTASQRYSVHIIAAVNITTATLADWTVNFAGYNQTITVTGGTTPYTITQTSGTLPTGLTLSGNVLSGKPTATGSYTFTITATDAVGGSSSVMYTVVINPPVSIMTTALPNGDVNGTYNFTVQAIGGTAPLTFGSSSGLPSGLTISDAGVLSGSPTTTGSYTFTIFVADSLGSTKSKNFTVTINPAVAITTVTLANSDVGASYSQTISATGGSGSYTFGSTALPSGLTLSSAGALSGSPTAAGSFTFTITASDDLGGSASQSYTITINPVVAISTTSLPTGDVGVAYGQTIHATGGTGSYTFTKTSGSLPGNLTLSSAGVLSGTPNAGGSFTFTITATDLLGGSGSQSYTLIINPAVSITTPTLSAGDAGSPYLQTIHASGGTGSYSFTQSSGSLPPGLSLGTSGVLSGTPTTPGSYTFTVTASDTLGSSASQGYTVTINTALSITTPTLANAEVNAVYSQTINASGGSGSYTFNQTGGSLPAGLSLSSTGVLSGTPTSSGGYSFTTTATDSVGGVAHQTYSITVFAALTISTTTLADWTAGVPYSQTITSTGGSGGATFSTLSGTLPAGVTLSSAGVLSGTPTTAGIYHFTMAASDSLGGSTSRAYTVTINPAVAITTTFLPNALAGTSYTQTIHATGGTGSFTFANTSGTLPAGLTLSSTGVLSGTPTMSASYTFTVTASDAVGGSGSFTYTIDIYSTTARTWYVDGSNTGSVDGSAGHPFVTIQDALNAVNPAGGDTIVVGAGTYLDGIVITTPVTLLGPNASTPGYGSRGPEAVIEPSPGSNPDTDSVFVIEASNVTISGFTIQGSNAVLTSGGFTLSTGTTVYAASAVSNATNVMAAVNGDRSGVVDITGLTVENNIIKDFKWAGVYGDTNNSSPSADVPSSGNLVTGNLLQDIPQPATPLTPPANDPAYAGEGVLIYDNFYADITNNHMVDVGTGIQTGNNYQPPSAGFTDNVTGNQISAYFRGLYYNLSYEYAPMTFNISNNTLTFDTDQPSFALSGYNVGLLIQSIANDTQSTISGNNASGFLYGMEIWNDNPTTPLEVEGGMLSGNQYGIWATNNDTRFGAGGVTDAVVNGVCTASSLNTDIFVDAPAGSGLSTVAVTVEGGTEIMGGPTGVAVNGALATLQFSGSAPAAFSGQTGDYIDLTDAAMSAYVSPNTGKAMDAKGVTFDGHGGSGTVTTLSQYYAIEDKITDYLDDPTVGYVQLSASNVYVAHSSETTTAEAIQRGVNVAVSGNTISVQAGTYLDGITITTPNLTLDGPNAGTPGYGSRGAEAVVEPGAGSSFDTDSVFLVQANNVTIDGFTIQGSNAALSSGGFTLTSGTTVYAAAGVSNSSNINTGGSAPSTTDISGLTVQNNIVQDFTQVGIYGDTSDGAVSAGNIIANNLIQDVPNNGQGGYIGEGVIIYDNFYADVTGNHLAKVRTGIQTGNNYLSSGAFAPSISGNVVSAYVKGIYYNLQYESASSFTVSNNTISQADGTVSPAYNVGLLIQSIQSSVSSVIQGNNVSGFLYGVEFGNNNTTSTVTLQGGTLNDNTYGVWDTNNDYFYPAPYNTSAALDGVSITNSTNAGIWVDSTSPNSGGQFDTTDSTTLAITDGTSVTGGPVGLLVDGKLSLITGNTLNNASFSGQTGNYITLANGALGGASPTVLDATGATFDGLGGTNLSTTTAQFYGIEDKVADYLDDPTLGYLKLNSDNVYVTQVSENTNTGAIQRGISVALSGDTVHVQSGTYHESPTINKSLTLQGDGRDTTTIHLLPEGTAGTAYLTPLLVTGAGSNVTIDGFTIIGNDAVGSGLANSNIYLDSTGLGTIQISDNRLEPGNFGSGTDGDDGYAIITAYTLTPANLAHAVNVTSNDFVPANGTLAGGLFAINPVSNFLFDANTIEGDFQGGGFTSALHGMVSNNTYTGTTPIYGGLFTFGYPDETYGDTTFTNNSVSHTSIGIGVFSSNDTSLSGNALSSDNTGLFVSNSVDIAGFDPSTLSVTGNTFSNNQYHVAYVDANNPSGELSVVGNTFDGVTLNGSTSLTNLFALEAKVLDKISVADGGLVRLRAGNVYITPSNFYSASTYADGSTVAHPTTVADLQRAVDAASTGNTIHVAGGTYGGDVNVNKAVTVQVHQSATLSGGNFNLSASGATLLLDADPAQFSVGNFTAGAGTVTDMNLDNSTTPGSGYDQIVASGTVTIAPTATINLSETTGFVPGPHSVFTLIDNTGVGAISGTFGNLADGSTLTLNGLPYLVTYEGGNGRSLTLSLEAPTTVYVGNDTAADFTITHDVAPSGLSDGDTVTWNPGGGQHPAGTVAGLIFGYNAFTSIQDGINAVASGGTVDVETGTYIEDLTIPEPLTVAGAGQGQTVVLPAVANVGDPANQGSQIGSSTNMVLVQANNVTIHDLTLDGNNPALAGMSGSAVVGGVNVDARNGIITDFTSGTFLNTVVYNTTVQNIFERGIYSTGVNYGNTFDFHDDTVTNVQGNGGSIAIFNFGGSGTIANNVVSEANDAISANWSQGTQFLNNTITDSGSGIHTDNNGGAGGVSDLIQGNHVSMGTTGAYGIFVFVPYVTVTVDSNTISGVDIGLAVFGGAGGSAKFTNNVVSTTGTDSIGAFVTTDQVGYDTGTASASFLDNTLHNNRYGIQTDDPTDAATPGTTLSITVTGNTITNNSVAGVDITGGSATLSQNFINANGTGVVVEDGFTYEDISAEPTGLSVEKTGTTVTAVGTATLFNNDLSGNTGLGVDNTTGTLVDASANWWGSSTLTGVQAAVSVNNVDFTPWLNSGTDTAPATPGFQGDFSYLNVSAASPQAGSLGRIQEGINDVTTGGTVNVLAGTYAENVNVNKAVTLLGAQAGQDANTRYAAFTSGANGPKADPTVETVVTAPSVDPQGSSPPFNDLFRVLASNVTIDGFVLDGNNPALNQTGAIQSANGINIDGEDGLTNTNAAGSTVPVGSVTVVHSIIQNFGYEGIQFDNGSNATPTTGSLFQGNVLSNNQADGVGLFDNFYGDVKNNTILVPANDNYAGIDLQNFYNDPGTLQISGNSITLGQDSAGIFMNLIYAPGIVFTVSSNAVQAATGVTGTDDLTFGEIIWSIQNGAAVHVQGDTIGTTGGQLARGIDVWNVPSNLVSITGTTIGSATQAPLVGVNFDNVDVYGGGASSTVALTNDNIVGGTYGVRIRADQLPTTPPFGTNVVTGSVEADISGGSISGGTADVYVRAPAASAPYTATVGLSGGVSLQNGTDGLDLDGPQTAVAGKTLNNTTFTGQTGNYITLANGALGGASPMVLDASGASFDGLGGSHPSTTLAQFYGIEDKVVDYLDDPTLGYVKLKAGNVYVAHSSETANAGAIQRGIDVAVTGDTVNVQAGTYVATGNFVDSIDGVVSEINVDKAITLLGPNPSFTPTTNTTPANPQAIILPGASDPNPFDATAITIIAVNASNVTIQGFTINGDNPALAGNANTIVYNGVPIDASEGISSYTDVGNITVSNNLVENTAYTGIDFENGSNSGNATTSNIITENLLQNLGGGGFGFGVGVVLYDNFYAAVTDNVMQSVRVGVQTGNFYQANPGGAGTALIADNQIAAVRRGIFYNLAYESASPFTVSGNSITAVEDATSSSKWDGILISSQQQTVSATFQNNTIDGSATASNTSQTSAGYEAWNTPTTGTLLVSGGTVSGVDYGVWVNTYEGYGPSNADNTQLTVSGVNIHASQIGVYIEDSPQNTNLPTPTASAEIENNTEITTNTATGVGILVSGATASANVHDNLSTITGNAIGIDVNGGSATVTSNTITTNGTGIRITAGGSLISATFNAITNNTADGILVTASAGTVNPIMCNDFSGDAPYGVENQNATVVDARKNYWGSPSGPTSPQNPVGTGVPVSSNVLFSPFATDAACTMFATPEVKITTTTLPNFTQGFAYNQTITAIGGTGTLTFSTTSGTLPTGLTLSTSGVLSGTPTTPGSFTFTVTATDTLNVSDSHTYTIVISPAVKVSATTVTAPEGTTVTNTGTFSNYNVTLSASVGNVTQDNVHGTWNWSGPAPDDTPYDVTISATGMNGVVSTATFHVAFTDVPPTFVSQAFDSLTTTSGVAASNSGVFSEFDDPPLVITASQGTLIDHGNGTWNWSQNGTPADSGTVTVTATNADGSKTSTTFTVTFNAALAITTTTLPNGILGQVYSQTISTSGGTGSVTFSVMSGTLPPGLTLSTSTGVISGTPTATGSYSFKITATDAVGATASQAYTVTVSALASHLIFSTEPANTATGVTMAPVVVEVVDAMNHVQTGDNSDTIIMSVQSGPGSFTGNSTTTVTVTNGVATFNNLTLIVPGTYSLHAALPALSTNAQSTSFSVAPLQVQAGSLAGTPSGFSVAFNAPYLVNSLTPVLYGTGFESTATVVPTVTLTEVAGTPPAHATLPFQVEGSVILNQATNSLTFLATNTLSLVDGGTPILPDGTYVVRITSSGANGMHAFFNAGGYLDGLDTGTPGSGDYTATFTVSTAGDNVVWVPPTADGPGQALNAPGNNQAGGGYPLYLDNTTGTVSSVSATLNYNPSLLTITSGSGSPGLTVTVTTPGTATVTYSGPALAAGQKTPIGYIGWTGPEPVGSLAGGGSLTTGTTYYYVITATDGGSESMPGLQSIGVTTAAGQDTVALTWHRGILADGYNIYRSTTPGSGYQLLATVSGANTLSYLDDGSQTPTATAPPTTGSTAVVPSGTLASPVPYKAKDLLHLSSVTVNGSDTGVVTSDGLHMVAYVGDADGNGSYTANDAVLLTRAMLNTDSGLTAYPLVDPVILGDTDGDGFMSSDGPLQANEAGVGLATSRLTIPAVPPGVTFTVIGNNVDPMLSVDRGPMDRSMVTVGVNIDDAHPAGSTGLTEGHLALTYDPRAFTVSAADVHLGSVLSAGSGWSVVPTIDAATGQIALAFSSDTPITSTQGGSLVTIDFHLRSGEPAASATGGVSLAASATPNGRYVTTELEDAQGAFTLSFGTTTSVVSLVSGAPNTTPVQPALQSPVSDDRALDTVAAGVEESTAVQIAASDGNIAPGAAFSAVGEDGTAGASNLAPTEALHTSAGHGAVVVAAVNSVASTAAASGAAAPLTGLVLPLAGTSLVSAAGGATGWQHLADQLFQALGRSAASDPALAGAVQVLERVVAGQFLLAQPTPDDLDAFNWDDAGSELDWRGADQSVLSDAGDGRETAPQQASSTHQQNEAEILDQVFADSADDADLRIGDDY